MGGNVKLLFLRVELCFYVFDAAVGVFNRFVSVRNERGNLSGIVAVCGAVALERAAVDGYCVAVGNVNAACDKSFALYAAVERAAVDGLIAKMKLTAAEYETLCAYMAGLTYSK